MINLGYFTWSKSTFYEKGKDRRSKIGVFKTELNQKKNGKPNHFKPNVFGSNEFGPLLYFAIFISSTELNQTELHIFLS